MNKHPEKIKLTVVNRYLNGEQISKITRDINISRTTAYAWIKQHNNSFNKGKAPNFRYLHDLEQKCERQQKIIEILKRSPCSPSAPLSKRYEVIQSLSAEYNVSTLCDALDVAKGSYYNHILRNKNGNTKAARKQSEMTPIIEQIFHENNKAFPVLSDIGEQFDDVLQVPLRLHRFGNVVAVGFEFVLSRGILNDLALFHRLDQPMIDAQSHAVLFRNFC